MSRRYLFDLGPFLESIQVEIISGDPAVDAVRETTETATFTAESSSPPRSARSAAPRPDEPTTRR
jgi:hypothetical protein